MTRFLPLLIWITVITAAAEVALPPNTGAVLVADVAGTTNADDTFWAEACKIIPQATALYIIVKMGAVIDYFKPATSGTTFCEMLQSNTKHQWSANGVDWMQVDFYGGSDTNGGSANGWPREKGAEGDERTYLSFWGDDRGSVMGGCCSSSTTVAATYPSPNEHWGQAFTVSSVVQLQPPPPNTGMSLLADVASTTAANDAFWLEKCASIPPSTLFLVVDMGATRDFIKPATSGTTFCEMLQSNTKHQWSANGVDWEQVDFYVSSTHNGGSAVGWPRDEGAEGDEREHLSFWGDDRGSVTGGCCSTSTTVADTGYWGQAFTVSSVVQLQPPPPNTGMSLLADVASTTAANDAFWLEKCASIPPSTLFLVVDMGATRDFIKPATSGTTFCEMLQSNTKHQWSANGVDWEQVDFYGESNHNGGSASWWPRDKGAEGDGRQYLSFWGYDGVSTGGCCSTSTAVATTGGWWGEAFTLSYGYITVSQEEVMQLANQVQQLTRGTTNLTDAVASEKAQVAALTSALASEKAQVAALTDAVAFEKAQVADVTENLTTCNGKLEQRRLARLAQTAADLANDQPADVDVDVDVPPESAPAGAIAGGVAAALVVVVVGGVAFMWWRKANGNGVQRNRRNNAEADELQGRSATLEMVENPMLAAAAARAAAAAAQNDSSSGGGSRNATESESGPDANLEGDDAAHAADVYYSEVAEAVRRDADGYVVDGSLEAASSPVYATYASSPAPDAGFYSAPAEDGIAAYAAPAASALNAPATSSNAAGVATYAASADGGVAYSRSASSSLAPGSNAGAGAYENSAVINTRMHSPKGKQGNRDSRAVPGGKSSRA